MLTTAKAHLLRMKDYPSLLVSSTAQAGVKEIERLEAKNKRLREALESCAYVRFESQHANNRIDHSIRADKTARAVLKMLEGE